MKIDFKVPRDGKIHRYCVSCHVDRVDQVHEGGKTLYACRACGHVNERAIYFNKYRWWLDDTGELWHDAAGVFVRNPAGQFLFFLRTEYPFVLTVPSGHVDENEEPAIAAARELEEEVGINAQELRDIATANIQGDSCSSGADLHRWHAYLLVLGTATKVRVREEGHKPVWLTLSEALDGRSLIKPAEYMLKHYAAKLQQEPSAD